MTLTMLMKNISDTNNLFTGVVMGGGVVFAGGRQMKIFSIIFRDFGKKISRGIAFSTLDGAGNYWKKITRNRDLKS